LASTWERREERGGATKTGSDGGSGGAAWKSATSVSAWRRRQQAEDARHVECGVLAGDVFERGRGSEEATMTVQRSTTTTEVWNARGFWSRREDMPLKNDRATWKIEDDVGSPGFNFAPDSLLYISANY
jgi:hypothetical protein